MAGQCAGPPAGRHGRQGGGVIEETFVRIWADLGGREEGPFAFRLILQPLMATIFAVKAGLEDARNGRPPYLWTIVTDRDERRELLREGWKAVATIFMIAIAIDVVYQIMVFGRIYPVEVLLVGFLLACVPYLVVRGLVTRVMTQVFRKVRS
jgi:hypothetical protein